MANDLATAAIKYACSGISVFPLAPCNKTPLLSQWQEKASTDTAKVNKWWKDRPDANIAIHVGMSGLVVLDVDPRNGGDVSLNRLIEKHGSTWLSSIEVKTGGGGSHFFYRNPDAKRLSTQLAKGIDLKHGRGYIVAPPSVHSSGHRYEFIRGGLIDGEIDFAPPIPEWFCRSDGLEGQSDDEWALTCVSTDPETPQNVDRVQSALDHISADCSRDEWLRIGFAVLSTDWSCAVELFREWSMTAPERFEEEAFRNVVDSAKSDRPNGITLGTLFAKAKVNGWKDPRTNSKLIETYGDISNGRRFAEKYRGELLYIGATRQWFSYDGLRWKPCESGQEMAAAKAIADQCLDEALEALRDDPTEQAKRNLTRATGVHCSMKRVEAMTLAAASEPGMSIANPGLLDADPMKFCVRNGVVDLRNGELIQGQPGMLLSRQSGAEYDPMAQCPMWLDFLFQVMSGDSEMVDYLQRICGYALTGLVDEERLCFMWGVGANGKSVFANVLLAVFGEYGVTVRAALLARDPKGGSGDAEREKCRLPGARLALMNETGQGDVWDDQRVKEITSRERISARQLYGESFDFMPTHMLFIRGNHQPGSMDSSDGFWRRILLIGFRRQFEESERIPDLDRQIIEHELPGVLAWMVDGCIEWQTHGLQTPASVKAAVNTYRKETDLMGEWLETCCTVSRGREDTVNALFTSYERFLKDANTKAPSRNTFGRQLIQRGFGKRDSSGRRYYVGLAVRNPFEDDEL